MDTYAASLMELPADHAAPGLLGLAERGWLPDRVIRCGIRRLCAERLRQEHGGDSEGQAERFAARVVALRQSDIALHVEAANRQHYELPPEFFRLCLGPRLKYSCCYYPTGIESLAEAEEAMLRLYADRAQLENGQDVLELGCGWGSLTLWMAERYPQSRIVAVSNSRLQREFIEAECRRQGFGNVVVYTQDVNHLSLQGSRFDRCVSVEMFEHIRNYERLLANIADLLKPGGKLFVHIFAHRTLMYPFETDGEDNWMGRHFFTGGLMPAVDTLLHFQQRLHVERRWLIDGTHYARTAEQWLVNQDRRSKDVLKILEAAYGPAASLWFQRWRMFWMACAELFGYADGQEWLVAHYRFERLGTRLE